MTLWVSPDFCHPEPGPELVSGSTISGSRFWFLKSRPVGEVLYYFPISFLFF
jgi:hypothetical protein